jgi:hypothetical protein
VFHGEAVAGEGVGGVGGEDFGEGGDLVHDLMVRCCGWGWQVLGRPRICAEDRGFRNRHSNFQKQVLPLRGRMTTLFAMA